MNYIYHVKLLQILNLCGNPIEYISPNVQNLIENIRPFCKNTSYTEQDSKTMQALLQQALNDFQDSSIRIPSPRRRSSSMGSFPGNISPLNQNFMINKSNSFAILNNQDNS